MGEGNGKYKEHKGSDAIAKEEHIFAESIDRIGNIHERMEQIERHVALLPQVKAIVETIASASTTMAMSAQSMANTHAQSEIRFGKLEDRYEGLVKTALEKNENQVPVKSYRYLILTSQIPLLLLSFVIAIGALWYAKYEVSVTRQSIEITQAKAVEEIKKEIKEVAPEVKQDAKSAKDTNDSKYNQ